MSANNDSVVDPYCSDIWCNEIAKNIKDDVTSSNIDDYIWFNICKDTLGFDFWKGTPKCQFEFCIRIEETLEFFDIILPEEPNPDYWNFWEDMSLWIPITTRLPFLVDLEEIDGMLDNQFDLLCLQKEVEEWCAENCQKVWESDKSCFYFNDFEEAVLCKLTWVN